MDFLLFMKTYMDFFDQKSEPQVVNIRQFFGHFLSEVQICHFIPTGRINMN